MANYNADEIEQAFRTYWQTGAVREDWDAGLLRKVIGKPEDEVHRWLTHLQAGEFIYEQPAFPEPEYKFKHALTHEVAYQSVLVDRRKVLHECTAHAIEELYRDDLDAHYDELAHHYSRTDCTGKAVEYLHLPGQQALQRSAYAEAESSFRQAIDVAQKDRRRFTDLPIHHLAASINGASSGETLRCDPA